MARRLLCLLALSALALAPASAAHAAAGFTTPVRIVTGGGPSTATDSAGHTFVAYGASGIHLATNRSGSWVNQTVVKSPSGTVDGSPSLGLDGQGHAHIAFARIDLTLKPVRSIGIFYATNRTGRWVVTRLTGGADTGPSLAVTGTGKVYIAFQRSGPASVRYTTNASGKWVTTIVSTAGSPAQPRVKLFGTTPYIAYNRTSTVSRTQPCGVYLWNAGGTSSWITSYQGKYNNFQDCWGFASTPQLGRVGTAIHVLFGYSGSPLGNYDTHKVKGVWRSDTLSTKGVSPFSSAVFGTGTMDMITAQGNDCRFAPGCGNGLYLHRWGVGGWDTVQLTTASDTCNQRGTTGTGPYTCDDYPSIQLFNGKLRVAFDRGSSVLFMHN